jgi:sporulation protein YlmC with PRC-barrel domain
MMKIRAATAALATIVGFAIPAAFAAEDTMTSPSASTSIQTIQPDQMRASKIIGADVYDRDNEKVGDVDDLILDRNGEVAHVVINVGEVLGMGGKDVAVHMKDIKMDNNRLTLSQTKDQLRQAATYQLKDQTTGAGSSPTPVEGGRAGSGTSTPPIR